MRKITLNVQLTPWLYLVLLIKEGSSDRGHVSMLILKNLLFVSLHFTCLTSRGVFLEFPVPYILFYLISPIFSFLVLTEWQHTVGGRAGWKQIPLLPPPSCRDFLFRISGNFVFLSSKGHHGNFFFPPQHYVFCLLQMHLQTIRWTQHFFSSLVWDSHLSLSPFNLVVSLTLWWKKNLITCPSLC